MEETGVSGGGDILGYLANDLVADKGDEASDDARRDFLKKAEFNVAFFFVGSKDGPV